MEGQEGWLLKCLDDGFSAAQSNTALLYMLTTICCRLGVCRSKTQSQQVFVEKG
jgi:hypothetical protein